MRTRNCSRREAGGATPHLVKGPESDPVGRYHAIDRRLEIFHFDRLDQMFRKACFETFLDVAIHSENADLDSGNVRDRAELTHQFNPSSVRQSDIADEKIEGT